jgi:hypothetical protein
MEVTDLSDDPNDPTDIDLEGDGEPDDPTVTIIPDPQPTATDDNVTVCEGSSINADVLANDDFGGNGPSTGAITITTNASNGVATVNNNGTASDPTDDSIDYTPNAGYTGTDMLSYEICDADGDCSTATLTITVEDQLSAGTNGTLNICAGETVTEAALFASLGGTPDAGGVWTPALAGAGIYTYTHPATANCAATSAQVVVTETTGLDAGENGTLTICQGETVTEMQLFNALGGTPDAGGIWTPALAGAGTYTYTHPAVGACPESSAQVVVTEEVCCPDAPILSIGEVSCVDGSTYEYTFAVTPGATVISSNGTISGNTVTVAVGTNDVLTAFSQVGCDEVSLSVVSPTSCNIGCEQPDLTLGNGVCNGSTYSVAFTETTGAILTTAPGNYTITGNVISGIPVGTDVQVTATNPNDGNCTVLLSVTSPDDCIDPCPEELISVSGLGECSPGGSTYSVNFTLSAGATLTRNPVVGTVGTNTITGIPAGTDITLIATNGVAPCDQVDEILVSAPDCCPDAPILSVGEVECVDGSTYQYTFAASPGATVVSANGTISGNTVTVAVGTNDVLSAYNDVNCGTIQVDVSSPVTCNIACVQPDLTLGNGVCEGATYFVTFTETTGATITTAPGNYTITGNVISGIPVGTDVQVTATNPNDGACAVTLTVVSPTDCNRTCPNELVSVSALGECSPDGNSYTVYYSLSAGATLSVSPVVGIIGANSITGVPAGTNLTLTATDLSCNTTDVIVVEAPDCCPDAPIASIGEVECVNGGIYRYTFAASPGATVTSANGSISGNTVTVAVGTNDVLTVYNDLNCESVTLNIASPVSCSVVCEQPDLTIGNGVCFGTTYSVTFTETTGATITTAPGNYTISGNTISGIPIGTNVQVTATNPSDGACALTLTAESPDDCNRPCPDELVSVSALGVCSPDLSTYSINFTLSPGATLSVSPAVGTIGANSITGIPAGTSVTLTATDAACDQTDAIIVAAPNCGCPDIAPPVSGGDQFYCAGDPVPTITASVPSGQTVNWYDAPTGGNLLVSNANSYTPTMAGTYYAEAEETASGCTSSIRTAISVTPIAITVSNVSTNDPTCPSKNDGSIVITASTNGTQALLYSIDNGIIFQPSNTFSGLTGGTYNIVVRLDDPLSCQTSAQQVILNTLDCSPTANDDSATTGVNTPVNIDVLVNDDFGGDGPSTGEITIIAAPINGIAVVNNGGTPNDPTDDTIDYTPNSNYSGSDNLFYRICDADGDCDDAQVTITVTSAPFVTVQVRVMLQGALLGTNDGLMRDDLRKAGIIPQVEPYTNLGFNHLAGGGGETVSNLGVITNDNGQNSIVDWVYVELRDINNPATVLATRAGLVQRDGDVVGMDGTTALTFSQSTAGSYYVSVRHRNHLGVMTASPIELDNSGVVVDFTSPSLDVFNTAPIHDGNERADYNGMKALWAGNTTADDKVVFAGQSNDKDPIFNEIDQAPGNFFNLQTFILSGYQLGDVNLDGKSIFAGQNNDVDPIFNNVDGYPANFFKLQTYVLPQQLP